MTLDHPSVRHECGTRQSDPARPAVASDLPVAGLRERSGGKTPDADRLQAGSPGAGRPGQGRCASLGTATTAEDGSYEEDGAQRLGLDLDTTGAAKIIER